MEGWKKHIGWLISAFFLVLVFRNVEWTQFIESLRTVSWWQPLILAAIYLFGYQIRGLRSLFLLPGLNFRQALGGVFIGYAANNVLPARLGEVVRAHVVGKSAGIKRTVAFSSVLVERIFDGSAIVVLLLIGAGELELPDWADQARSLGIVLFSLALAAVLVVGWTHTYWDRYLPTNRIGDLARGLFEGVALAVRTPLTLFLVLSTSLFIWTVEAFMFYWCAYAFGIDLSFKGALFVMSIVNLGVLIPSSPGGLGLFQFFCVKSLEFFGVGHAQAIAYSVLVHLCQYIPVTTIGLLWLPRFGVHLNSREIEQLDYPSNPDRDP
jgi:uncharacterized membrane protein YbhN (UPF0104 family)